MPGLPRPHIRGPGRRPVTAVALVLHGGRATSERRGRPWQLAALRMLPFARSLHAAAGSSGLTVWRLRYRYRGWNGDAADPVPDARWALDEVRRRHGDVPVVLVGHSLGGRVAVRVADDRSVVAVAALAPWVTENETSAGFVGRSLVVAHGNIDRMTDPDASYRLAFEARQVSDRVARFELVGDRHAMLRRAADWHDLVTRFALSELGIRERDPLIEAAMTAPPPEGLRTEWPRGSAKVEPGRRGSAKRGSAR